MLIDTHIHHYPDIYLDFLKQRKEPPFIINRDEYDRFIMFSDTINWKEGKGLKILPDFYSYEEKLDSMQKNNVDRAVLSLGNPWLDFIPISESISMANEINNQFSRICVQYSDQFWGLACLPAGDLDASIEEVKRIKDLPGIVGILMSSKLGNGWIDENQVIPFWELINDINIPVFIHPYYSVGGTQLANYDDMLRFSLGFPFETTFIATRLIMSGILDIFPNLRIILAHGGGAFPSLVGRIEAYCSGRIIEKIKYPIKHYLRMFYYDAITYSPQLLRFISETVGVDRLVFGTDYPFAANDTNSLVQTVLHANFARIEQEMIFSENAIRLFSK